MAEMECTEITQWMQAPLFPRRLQGYAQAASPLSCQRDIQTSVALLSRQDATPCGSLTTQNSLTGQICLTSLRAVMSNVQCFPLLRLPLHAALLDLFHYRPRYSPQYQVPLQN